MNDDVDDGQVDRLGAARPGRASGRCPLVATRPAGRAAGDRRAGPARRRRRSTRRAPRWSRTSVKPPVDAPTSRQVQPGRVDRERVERRRQLVAAPRDVRLRAIDRRRDRRIDEVARTSGRAAPRRPRRPGPGRPGRAPGRGCASRRGRARRAAGRAAGAAPGRPGSSPRSPAYRGTARHRPAGRRGRSCSPGRAPPEGEFRPRGPRRGGAPETRPATAPARASASVSRIWRLDARPRRAGSAGAGRPPSRGRRTGHPGSR